jgi:ATP-dependent exoDNAse (exonuclease V) beta subunit
MKKPQNNLTQLADANERKLIRTALDRNMVVEAAAGTGKTTELVHRIIAVIAGGHASVASLVAVTFTEKAAGELKLRLRAALEHARQQARPAGAERNNLDRALSRLEEARVSTIHGFCADLLHERPVEAGIDPQFQTMTDQEAERLFSEAFELWLQQKLEQPPEGIRRSLCRSTKYGDEGPSGRLRAAAWTLADWRDFPALWRRNRFDREAQLDALVEHLHAFAAMTRRSTKPADSFYLDTERARLLSDEIRNREAVQPRDYDRLEAVFVSLVSRDFEKPRQGYGNKYGDGVTRAEVHASHREFCDTLRRFARAADADLAALLRSELSEAVERYERLKERSGRVDFVDLLLRARNLIRDCAEVRAEFQRRFTHIFVDEFQDTDPLQAEILLLLAADSTTVRNWREVVPAPGKLFLVGDPKQSIYRFRRADVGVYLEVKTLLARQGALCLNLTTSFRAIPALQNAINAAFSPLMNEDRTSLQAGYVALSPSRPESGDQPALVVLPVPRPYGKRSITMTAIDQSLPDAIGAFVEWLLHESGWTVTERERPQERVPVSARHVCLLLRRFDSFFAGDITRGYVQALEARGIPHLLVGGKSFYDREEVETIRAAIQAIEWPDDELSVFATLRGSLYALGDEELLEYRHRFKGFNPFRVPEALPAHLAPVGDALSLLASLHRNRNHRPIAESIGLLLENTRAHASFVLRPSGEQALANVLHLAELARAYEASGGISFRGFVDRLLEDAEKTHVSEAPVLEEGSDGVRIMTVHKAKGLEFPVVILADMTGKLARSPSGRYIDAERGLCAIRIGGWSPAELLEHESEEFKRDEAEGVRITYVAATRARDLLVVPAVGDAPFESGWLSPLNAAIYPNGSRRRQSTECAGCPPFGDDSVFERPDDALGGSNVKPGLHVFEDKGYGVVWWDPAQLKLDAQPRFGIRQENLIGKEVDPSIINAGVARHAAWRTARDTALELGSRPSFLVRTATETAAVMTETGAEVQVVELTRDSARPAGPRYGTLVHAVLATVQLDPSREQVDQAARLQGRILGATEEEIRSACTVAASVLQHSLMARARKAAASGRCRRETPIALRQPDGSIVDGIIDLAFLENGTWTVVDFKTDRELERGLPVYRRQVGLYASAIQAATGVKTAGVLMRI